MPESFITAEYFQKRLARLCLTGGVTALPRSTQDRQVLFKSMQLMFRPAVEYSEREVTELLERWLAQVAPNLECDAVTLRRFLVDHGYLLRPADGSRYTTGSDEGRFEAGVDHLDPAEIIARAQAQGKARKAAFTKREESRES
jgi:hypothetical protein